MMTNHPWKFHVIRSGSFWEKLVTYIHTYIHTYKPFGRVHTFANATIVTISEDRELKSEHFGVGFIWIGRKLSALWQKYVFWPFCDLDLDLWPDQVAIPPKIFTERSVVYMPIFKQFCPAVWESIRHQDLADTHTDRPTILYIYREDRRYKRCVHLYLLMISIVYADLLQLPNFLFIHCLDNGWMFV